ncbi:ECF transporter S component [Petralouisia muris]|uniref:ECF transporter S component n=1 Tax=Petralouisia muris TaxID=3032872 RepID=A0AC61RY87_9FIRM|nr:ECF transporter S component [Petralouisia muris]TGY96671.1 ECF transporter S component [Petralouisia muris]
MNQRSTATAGKQTRQKDIWKMTMTAMLSAIAFLLMFLEFSVPIMPAFIKMDLSELPALIGAFAMGPVSGAMICLIKNLLHLFMTTTGGVGELSNFILGASFVVPAGLIYRKWKGKKSAVAGALAGAVLMAVISVFSNYFIVYPVYYNFMPEETVLAAYQMIFPGVKNMLQCLIVFNAPFTFVKGVFSVVITVLVYKPLSPFLKGNYRGSKAPGKNTGYSA